MSFSLRSVVLTAPFALAGGVVRADDFHRFNISGELFDRYTRAYSEYEAASVANYEAPGDDKAPSLAALARAEDRLFVVDGEVFGSFKAFLIDISATAPAVVTYYSGQGGEGRILHNAFVAHGMVGVDVPIVAVDMDRYPTLSSAYVDRQEAVHIVYGEEIVSELYGSSSIDEMNGFIVDAFQDVLSHDPSLYFVSLD